MFNVIVIDDEPSVIEGLKLLVDWQKLGFCICGEATDGASAYEIIKENRPPLIITDIKMPLLDGFQLIEKIDTELFPYKPKFIIISGFADFQYAKKAMRYGVSDFLVKPLDASEVSETIAKVRLQLIDEQTTHEETLEVIRRCVKDCFLRIVYGPPNEKLIKKLDLLLDFRSKRIKVLFITLENYFNSSDSKNTKILSSLPEIIAKRNGQKYENRIFYSGAGDFVIFLSDDTALFGEYEGWCTAIQDEIYENTGYSSRFLFSGEIQSISSLKECASHIDFLKQVQYYSPSAKIYSYGKLKHIHLEHDFTELPYNDIISAIKNGSESKIYSAVDQFFLILYKYKPANKLLTIYLHQLASRINSLGSIEGVRTDDELSSYIKAVSTGSLQNSKDSALEMCMRLYKKLHFHGEKTPTDLENEILHFINNNFKNEISLQSLGDDFSLDPMIISKIVKKRTGQKFNDYLNKIKIENAMKLIASTDIKISHVCEMVGYKDYPYFVNKFKELVGVLPSEYKRSFV